MSRTSSGSRGLSVWATLVSRMPSATLWLRGAFRRAVTVALLLPADSTIGFVRGVMRGAELAAERYGASIVGGDTKQNPKFAIVVTVVGTARRTSVCADQVHSRVTCLW